MSLINTVLIMTYCTYKNVILKTANKSNLEMKENNI